MKITLDQTIIKNIRELTIGDESDFLTELICVYERDSKRLVYEIHSFFKGRNFNGLKKSAHNLKGASANLGGKQLAEACLKLEVAAGRGDLQELNGLLRNFNEIYEGTIAELESQKQP
jgi:HPt (histidine-containing phosphotransfer) domain-containing protein